LNVGTVSQSRMLSGSSLTLKKRGNDAQQTRANVEDMNDWRRLGDCTFCI